MKKHIALLVVVTLCGCATGYHTSGWQNAFDETALAPDTYRVSFAGNTMTSLTRAQEMIELRAADIAIKNGYPYFALINKSSHLSTAHIANPTTITYNPGVYSQGVVYQNATATVSGGGSTAIQRPAVSATIKLLRTKISDDVYDADFIYNSLSTKYGVKNKDK